ncbi:MAG TPA: phosphotransferase [Anaerolineales bacterium]|nr:phosphotransferase [Anaerolineales bacterium]
MYSSISDLLTVKPRVLLVDEDPEARVSYQALLMEWGYDPVLAMGRGIALQNDARTKAQEHRCSLALIDLRLMDNDDEADISGLKLAQELKATRCIAPVILSGYESIRVHRLLREDIEIGFIGKQDRRSEIQGKLDGIAARVCAAKRGLQYTETEILDEFLQSEIVRQMGVYANQVANVLARLFPDAKTLGFERLVTPGSSVSSAIRPNSIVLKVYEDDKEACVVKMARTSKIKKEADNFRRYISRRFTEGLSLQQIGKEELAWDISGIAYTYQGGKNARTFTNYYKDRDIADIREVLSDFFLAIWQKYYRGGRHNPPPLEKTNTSLYALYTATWGSDWHQKAREISPQILKRIEPFLRTSGLPQPLEWLENKLSNGDPEFQPVNTVLTAVTHGDLHSDNLLVDDRKNIGVIDYERCGEGHALQDFIELEADILNRLQTTASSHRAYWKMCLTLFKQDEIRELEEAETVSAAAHVDKAFKTISMIRGFAAQCIPNPNIREYLTGLLFNMLFRAALVHKEDPQNSERPLVIAGFICHRLDHWNEPWPPAEWNFSQETL